MSGYILSGGRAVESLSKKNTVSHKKTIIIWLFAIFLLVFVQGAYQITASRLNALAEKPVELESALSQFPYEVGDWIGEDLEVSETVLKVAGNDDYLMRSYTNSKTGQVINLYIAYSARPRTMRGHRPDVCYPASGWIHDGTDKEQICLSSGRKLASLIHSFHKPMPEVGSAIVLNYYILNGRVITDEDEFSGLMYRTVNLSGRPDRYVTQVQISAVMSNTVLAGAKDFSEIILNYFPGTSD